jgi:hypothetical protein
MSIDVAEEKSDLSPTSSLEAMHEAVHRAQVIFLRHLMDRVEACGNALELCADELKESGISLSSDVFKTWRAVDKYLSQLLAELETECDDVT